MVVAIREVANARLFEAYTYFRSSIFLDSHFRGNDVIPTQLVLGSCRGAGVSRDKLTVRRLAWESLGDDISAGDNRTLPYPSPILCWPYALQSLPEIAPFDCFLEPQVYSLKPVFCVCAF